MRTHSPWEQGVIRHSRVVLSDDEDEKTEKAEFAPKIVIPRLKEHIHGATGIFVGVLRSVVEQEKSSTAWEVSPMHT